MTKLMGPVDSAATRGARKEAVQTRAPTLKVRHIKGQARAQSKSEVSISHEHQSAKITIRPKSGHHR
jgi:hypothetical protein